MTEVLSTYRLQLHSGFTLDQARALAPYLRSLGVTHVHSSPVLRAQQGSTHGYDVTDPTAVNPELGGEEAFAAFATALRAEGLGLVLDIVPNHMAASRENPYWEDVLTHGPASPYARWFDIDWRAAPGYWSRVLLPVLGDLRVHVLARGELQLGFDGGRLRMHYYENDWPLDPGTLAPVLDAAARACADRAGEQHEGCAELRAIAATLRRLPRRTAQAAEALKRRWEGTAANERIAALALGLPVVGAAIAGAAAGFGAGEEGRLRMRRLLDAQVYRLVYWRRAAREINYRRFFDVNELIALHMEDPEVFRESHALLLRWRDAGWLDGFRVDHPDGLLDPAGYLERLVDAASAPGADAPGADAPGADAYSAEGRCPVWVEKILSCAERLREEWPVAGTTGYDFLNQVEGVFIDPAGSDRMAAEYRRVLRGPLDYASIARLAKRQVLETAFSAGVRRLAERLDRLSRAARPGSPLRLASIMRAVVETIVYLPVYRTYVQSSHPVPTGEDLRLLQGAIGNAREHGRAQAEALDCLEDALLGKEGPMRDPSVEGTRLRFVERFQQLSGPATAKGIEDTAFYVYVPLLSRNEVGGEPDASLTDAVSAFHAANAHRAERWPRAMLAVTTHDTKRSADLRARLDVLSELPEEWEERLYRWRRTHREHKTTVGGRRMPDVNTLWLFWQSLVGIWPLDLAPNDGAWLDDLACLETLRARMQEYMQKATREAKVHTSWIEPHEEFESAVRNYVDRVFSLETGRRTLTDLSAFVTRIGRAGLWNALARTLLHVTAPGIPDLYQGDELWNFTLVDPDNRRPVDFDRRRALLAEVIAGSAADADERRGYLRDIVEHAGDGRIKLHVLHHALSTRRRCPDLFAGGTYEPLVVTGALARHLIAFARRQSDAFAVIMAPRLLLARLRGNADLPLGRHLWRDTSVHLPGGELASRLVCALTGEEVSAGDGAVSAASALAHLPVALLLGGTAIPAG